VFSVRFQKPVVITKHAQSRMIERAISEAMLLDLIDTGTEKYKDPSTCGLQVLRRVLRQFDLRRGGARDCGRREDGYALRSRRLIHRRAHRDWSESLRKCLLELKRNWGSIWDATIAALDVTTKFLQASCMIASRETIG
jgi:hypothetical protein